MWFQRLLVPAICVATGIVLAAWGDRTVSPVLADEKSPAAADTSSAKALLEAAKTAYEGYFKRRQVDVAAPNDSEFAYRWSRRWLKSERALDNAKEKRIAASAAHLERMRKLEAFEEKLVEQHFASKLELAPVKFYRIEAEQWVAEAKAR
ncbi:MAG TPA: hypothetical protein VK395_06920 [Gemmataceae bacterium]|nr:hypothetical protein [Gemmataceae bacterium]